MQGSIALTIAIVGGALAQLLMKSGVQGMEFPVPTAPLLLGIGCYGLAMISWTFALKHYDLSLAYPLLSIGYLLVYVGAFVWPGLEEELSWQKTTGMILIVLGVTISTGKHDIGRVQHDRH